MTSSHARSDIHGTGFLEATPAVNRPAAANQVQTGWTGLLDAVVEKLEEGVRQFWTGTKSAFSGKPTPINWSPGRHPASSGRVPPIIRRSVPSVSLPRPTSRRSVWFNRTLLSDNLLPVVDHIFRRRVADGHYWYDYVSGEWGVEGRGRSGKIRHGLELGGPLAPDASKGKTGVFVNGREITSWESILLRWATHMGSGRYWVDHNGNFGPENGSAMGNVRRLANITAAAER